MPGTTNTIEPTSERQRAQLRDHVARHRLAQQDERLREARQAAKADELNQAHERVDQLTREKAQLERELANALKGLRRAWTRTAKQKKRAEMWRARAMKRP